MNIKLKPTVQSFSAPKSNLSLTFCMLLQYFLNLGIGRVTTNIEGAKARELVKSLLVMPKIWNWILPTLMIGYGKVHLHQRFASQTQNFLFLLFEVWHFLSINSWQPVGQIFGRRIMGWLQSTHKLGPSQSYHQIPQGLATDSSNINLYFLFIKLSLKQILSVIM